VTIGAAGALHLRFDRKEFGYLCRDSSCGFRLVEPARTLTSAEVLDGRYDRRAVPTGRHSEVLG
jgi:hypothetical protein